MLGAMLVSAPAGASDDTPRPPTVREIVTQQSHVRAMVVAGRGPFKDMSAEEREVLLQSQTRVLELLDGHTSIDELSVDERVELFKHLQSVKTALTRAEGDRQICERSRIVGSHRFRLVCLNADEYRRYMRSAQDALSSASP
jgi:hypothetical protein